jgi:DNA-binding NarL/FixJ family response regulator
MTPDQAAGLISLAAELVGTVRDFGPDDVAAVLARVPDGRHDALAVVLAAMVDPDATPTELLAWTTAGPVKSREYIPRHLFLASLPAEALGRHPERREEVRRLTAAGVSAQDIAARLRITTRAVTRHRAAILAEAAVAS